MSLYEAILLGLIQGLTEFLPVSSSGHLALAKPLLGIDSEAGHFTALVVFVHLGTAFSVLTVYRQQVASIIIQTLLALRKPSRGMKEYHKNESLQLAVMITATLIPTGIAYVFMKDSIDAFFAAPHWVGAMLIFTAVLLTLTLIRPNPDGKINLTKAIIIGCAQSFAMLPGISRSGSTIAAAIYLGVNRQHAANFSFLMALPVIFAGALLEGKDLLHSGINSSQWIVILASTLTAYLSGLVAIKLVLGVIKRGKLQYFAIYCLLVGILAVVMLK